MTRPSLAPTSRHLARYRAATRLSTVAEEPAVLIGGCAGAGAAILWLVLTIVAALS